MDGHNIFKRIDRYKNKIALIILFLILTLFNLFEIVLNILLMTIWKKKTDEIELEPRVITSIITLFHLFAILFLSSITIVKLKIQSYIYY